MVFSFRFEEVEKPAVPDCKFDRNVQPPKITKPCVDKNAVCITVDGSAYDGTCFCKPEFQYDTKTGNCSKGTVFLLFAVCNKRFHFILHLSL